MSAGCGKSGTGEYGGVGPSEAEEKPTSSISIRRAGKVGAPGTWDSFSPPLGKKREKNEKKTFG
jgi:hypothetical protein